jgi:signal transduction histidine kinase
MTNVLALVQSLADDMIDLGQPVSFSSDVDKAVAAVQPVALRRVLCNLLVNAVRYGVRAEVSLTRNDKAIVVNVDDFGPGIPESQIEAVKQPFFRLDASRRRSTGGAGLGLYIAHDLLSRQGCALELSNRAAGGLRAAVSMPL